MSSWATAVERWRASPRVQGCFVAERELPARPGRFAHALKHVAVLLVLCDGGDVAAAIGDPASPAHLPRIYLHDVFPGGAGLGERLFEARDEPIARALRLCASCGCPACVGALAASAAAVEPSPRRVARSAA
jgi:hypothetical protein